MKFAQILEQYTTTTGEPLYEQANNTTVDYVKYEFSHKGEGFPVESFRLYDSSKFFKKNILRSNNEYMAIIDVLLNQNGSIYPQISIIQGNKSYSIWDGKERKGTSGLRLLQIKELNEQQKMQIKTILNILKGALPRLNQQNTSNQTFNACLKFFDLMQQKELTNQKKCEKVFDKELL